MLRIITCLNVLLDLDTGFFEYCVEFCGSCCLIGLAKRGFWVASGGAIMLVYGFSCVRKGGGGKKSHRLRLNEEYEVPYHIFLDFSLVILDCDHPLLTSE